MSQSLQSMALPHSLAEVPRVGFLTRGCPPPPTLSGRSWNGAVANDRAPEQNRRRASVRARREQQRPTSTNVEQEPGTVTPEVAGSHPPSAPCLTLSPKTDLGETRKPLWSVRGTRRQPAANAGKARTGKTAQRATNGDRRGGAANRGAELSRRRSRVRVPPLPYEARMLRPGGLPSGMFVERSWRQPLVNAGKVGTPESLDGQPARPASTHD